MIAMDFLNPRSMKLKSLTKCFNSVKLCIQKLCATQWLEFLMFNHRVTRSTTQRNTGSKVQSLGINCVKREIQTL
jgi:hypothetical protein